MPYKSEHAARIIDPSEFTEFRRENNAFGSGIHAVYGIREGEDEGLRGGHAEIQSIRFDAAEFSPGQAERWLDNNDIDYLSFHPAVNSNPKEAAWLPLRLILPAVPEMARLGVSEVARSSRGFLAAYEKANGDPRNLGDSPEGEPWRERRNNFIARHYAQVEQHDEPLWTEDGEPTRRHLALVAWAWTPDRKRWERWLKHVEAAPKLNPRAAANDTPVLRAIAAREQALTEIAMKDAVRETERKLRATQKGVHEYTQAHWGVAPDVMYEVTGHAHIPRNEPLIEMGKLRELWVTPAQGKPYILEFDDVHTMLCFTRDKAQRLYIILSDSDRQEMLGIIAEDYEDTSDEFTPILDIAVDVGGRQAKFPYPDIDVISLGVLTHVVYLTEKRGDDVSEYKHQMGEHGGISPELCVDADGYLHIVGGSYSVPNRGIVY